LTETCSEPQGIEAQVSLKKYHLSQTIWRQNFVEEEELEIDGNDSILKKILMALSSN